MIDRRMLIADDDTEVRLGAADLLVDLGLEILFAGSGDQALAIVRESELHLVLLDFHMPGVDGLEVFQTIHAETPLLPCILWSGAASEAIESVALRSGVQAFLRKPVRPELLRQEVRRALDSHWGAA